MTVKLWSLQLSRPALLVLGPCCAFVVFRSSQQRGGEALGRSLVQLCAVLRPIISLAAETKRQASAGSGVLFSRNNQCTALALPPHVQLIRRSLFRKKII